MSVEDTTITFQDRRDEVPPRVVVIFTDVPDELNKTEVQFLFKTAQRQAMKAIDVKPRIIDISVLQAARDAGDISQALYDQLTGSV